MDPLLKVHGGHTGSAMLHHPFGASLGALALAAPCTWIAASADGAIVGAVVGLVGLVMGAPLGAMLADSAAPDTSADPLAGGPAAPLRRPH